jgi:AraC-like DNA-binding protein
MEAHGTAPALRVKHRATLPGVSMCWRTLDDGLCRSVPHRYGTIIHLEGESHWSFRGSPYSTRPGTVGVRVPVEVHTETARRGRSRFELVLYDDALVEHARAALDRRSATPRAHWFDGPTDARVRPLMRLHRAIDDDASSPGALEQALAEALSALVELTSLPSSRADDATQWSHAVRRARALLDERLTETVTLDELAAHAQLDKFRLCRAFRDQVGLPPYAYLTHRRVSLAQELLGRGLPQIEVAAHVGLYDQSQLHRHFKRILGITPGAYARAVRNG